MVHPFLLLYNISNSSFLDCKDTENEVDVQSASNLVLHPSASVMMRFTTTPHDGLTDNDNVLASDYGPDSVFYNCCKFPSHLIQ